LIGVSRKAMRKKRWELGVYPTYKRVDTCAAEFQLAPRICTQPMRRVRSQPNRDKKKSWLLGGGPNRIGQGIEFDYCCVHAALGDA
jgi:carbamoyl-phosphate synthase large subunit